MIELMFFHIIKAIKFSLILIFFNYAEIIMKIMYLHFKLHLKVNTKNCFMFKSNCSFINNIRSIVVQNGLDYLKKNL